MTGLHAAMDRFERARDAFAVTTREVQGGFANPLPKDDSAWSTVERILGQGEHIAGMLVVHPNRDHARRDGFPVSNVVFKGNARIEAWWPDAGPRRVIRRRFQVVILMSKAIPLLTPEVRGMLQDAVDAAGARGQTVVS